MICKSGKWDEEIACILCKSTYCIVYNVRITSRMCIFGSYFGLSDSEQRYTRHKNLYP